MKGVSFHHALTVREELCQGCTRCMRNCPTEAIRLFHGKAHVHPDKCIDCGQCMDACPFDAIVIEQDDFEKIFSYNYRVAILPSVFIGQFADDIPERYIYKSLLDIGFNEVYEAEFGVDILQTIGNRFSTYADDKPVISSYCPAIVRLIQIKYPTLVKHINLLRPPVEITAMYIRKKLLDRGIDPKDIGIFYVTPCAAKIAQIKSPEQQKPEDIFTGVINLDYIYNLVQSNISKNKKILEEISSDLPIPPLTPDAGLWSLTTGESSTVSGRTLAIDEIHNVIDFLEKLENDEVKNLDFLELRACAGGCAGGVLNPGNRFLAKERLFHRSQSMKEITLEQEAMICMQASYLQHYIKRDRIEAKAVFQLDEDISKALEKLENYQKVVNALPGIDCGLCGAPTCSALAEDISKGIADITQCAVLKLRRTDDNLAIKKVWGNSLEPHQP